MSASLSSAEWPEASFTTTWGMAQASFSASRIGPNAVMAVGQAAAVSRGQRLVAPNVAEQQLVADLGELGRDVAELLARGGGLVCHDLVLILGAVPP